VNSSNEDDEPVFSVGRNQRRRIARSTSSALDVQPADEAASTIVETPKAEHYLIEDSSEEQSTAPISVADDSKGISEASSETHEKEPTNSTFSSSQEPVSSVIEADHPMSIFLDAFNPGLGKATALVHFAA